MGTPDTIVAGMKFGKLVIRMKLPTLKEGPVNMRHRVRVQCDCGTEAFTIPLYYLRRKDPKVDCGCGRKTIKTIYNEEYRIWLMMHKRTEDEKHVSYKDYGGRGIRVCPEWNRNSSDGGGFARFIAFVGKRPSPQHTIDRVNNDAGYQPYLNGKIQVKWSTPQEQRANQRPAKRSAA
jgi:hypothetical protein